MSDSMNFMRLTGSSADAERRLQRTAERKARGVAQQMIERDGAPWIVGALPRGDRHRLVSFSAPLRTRMPASAEITDLVAEKPSSGVSMPMPSA